MRRTRLRPGFTLVELLIVVAIIALLISIGLPSMRKARKQAKAVICSTHLHAQSQALQIHFNEHNGQIPREYRLPSGPPPFGSFMPYAGPLAIVLGYQLDLTEALEPQFREMPEFQCPDFPRDKNTVMQQYAGIYPQFANETSDDQPIDYVFNDFQLNYDDDVEENELKDSIDRMSIPKLENAPGARLPISRISWIRKPGQIIYLSEAHAVLPAMTGMHDVFRGGHLPRGSDPRVAVDMRHPTGINSMFFDGHIESALPEKHELHQWFDPDAHAVNR